MKLKNVRGNPYSVIFKCNCLYYGKMKKFMFDKLKILNNDICQSLSNILKHEIVKLYLDWENDVEEKINSFDLLLESDNIEILKKQIHSIKGSSLQFGAQYLGLLLGCIEKRIENNDICPSFIPIIKNVFNETCIMLKNIYK